ncbi:MAG: hypothetical protein PVF05_03785 [Gemmatimonadales bacterium]|jgi:hypothetical protein
MNAKPTREAEDAMSVVPAEIRELLEQRGTYREWLRRLDEVGSQYRNDVAERVRADYRARLDGVGEELEKHRHELVSTLDGRRGRLDELSEAFERRSAELEEAELRFQVGEYDDAIWDEKRAELTEGLEEIEADLNDQRSAVEELERVLAELSSGGAGRPAPREAAASAAKVEAVAATGPAMAEATAEAADAEKEDAGESGEAPREEPAAPERPESSVEEEAEEQEAEPIAASGDMEPAETEDAGADATAAAEASGPEPRPSEDDAVEPARDEDEAVGGDADEDYMDELEFLESLSLDDPDSFDAVSRMLEDEEDR